MKLIVKLTVFLAVVAGLSAGAMSYVFNLTNPIIIKAQAEAEKEQLSALYSDSDFTEKKTDLKKYDLITAVYEAKRSGKTEGYVYKISTPGYGGNIIYLIALDNDGTYKGYSTIDVSTETSGFGSRVGTDEMKKKIVGKKIGDHIDTLSGATISSTAVVNGITQATEHYNKNFK